MNSLRDDGVAFSGSADEYRVLSLAKLNNRVDRLALDKHDRQAEEANRRTWEVYCGRCEMLRSARPASPRARYALQLRNTLPSYAMVAKKMRISPTRAASLVKRALQAEKYAGTIWAKLGRRLDPLIQAGFQNVGDILIRSDDELLAIPNFGPKLLSAVRKQVENISPSLTLWPVH